MSEQFLFRDRQDAGQQLAQAILDDVAASDLAFISSSFVVYALPRGGIPVAMPIAQRLGCPLDIIVAKKVTLPDNPELAIGAVTADGQVIRSRQTHFTRQTIPSWRSALQEAHDKANYQQSLMADSCPAVDPAGAIAIIVDDGIATGMTIAVAARALRVRHPAHIYLCAPVAPRSIIGVLNHWADRVIVLATPANFLSVSRFYREFHQVETDEAIACLKRQNQQYVS